MGHISTEAEVVPAKRPGQGVRKLHLMTKDVGGPRLSNDEWRYSVEWSILRAASRREFAVLIP